MSKNSLSLSLPTAPQDVPHSMFTNPQSHTAVPHYTIYLYTHTHTHLSLSPLVHSMLTNLHSHTAIPHSTISVMNTIIKYNAIIFWSFL